MKELWKLSAREAVGLLKRKKVSPLELIECFRTKIGFFDERRSTFSGAPAHEERQRWRALPLPPRYWSVARAQPAAPRARQPPARQ